MQPAYPHQGGCPACKAGLSADTEEETCPPPYSFFVPYSQSRRSSHVLTAWVNTT
jgi:hypothetical protein